MYSPSIATTARVTLTNAKQNALQQGPGVYPVVLPSGNQIATIEVEMDIHRRVSAFVHLTRSMRMLLNRPWSMECAA